MLGRQLPLLSLLLPSYAICLFAGKCLDCDSQRPYWLIHIIDHRISRWYHGMLASFSGGWIIVRHYSGNSCKHMQVATIKLNLAIIVYIFQSSRSWTSRLDFWTGLPDLDRHLCPILETPLPQGVWGYRVGSGSSNNNNSHHRRPSQERSPTNRKRGPKQDYGRRRNCTKAARCAIGKTKSVRGRLGMEPLGSHCNYGHHLDLCQRRKPGRAAGRLATSSRQDLADSIREALRCHLGLSASRDRNRDPHRWSTFWRHCPDPPLSWQQRPLSFQHWSPLLACIQGYSEAALFRRPDSLFHYGLCLPLQLLGHRLHSRFNPVPSRTCVPLLVGLDRLVRLLLVRQWHFCQFAIRQPSSCRSKGNRSLVYPYGCH